MAETIAGPAGRLELALCPAATEAAPWVVVCHPHPQYGGAMDNPVVAAIVRGAGAAGYGTCAFNFRGVGRSAGTFDGGEGETDDLEAVIAHLAEAHGSRIERLVIGGYSFGALVAAQGIVRGVRPRAALWVSPPIGVVPLPDAVWGWNGPKQVLTGSLDGYCPAATAQTLCDQAAPRAACHIIEGADHFYGGFEGAVASAAHTFLAALNGPAA